MSIMQTRSSDHHIFAMTYIYHIDQSTGRAERVEA